MTRNQTENNFFYLLKARNIFLKVYKSVDSLNIAFNTEASQKI